MKKLFTLLFAAALLVGCKQNQPVKIHEGAYAFCGASGAIRYALENLNCEVIFVSRTSKKNLLTYEELTENLMNSVDLIVNSTPLGTYPDTNQAPQLPYQFLNEQHLLFDLIYNPSETLFMKKGIEKGAQVCNGYQMLVYQAEKSWELWNQ